MVILFAFVTASNKTLIINVRSISQVSLCSTHPNRLQVVVEGEVGSQLLRSLVAFFVSRHLTNIVSIQQHILQYVIYDILYLLPIALRKRSR